VMERRLSTLETLWQADPQTVSQASYSIEWAVKWPRMGLRDEEPNRDPAAIAERIRETYGLDDVGITRAIETALTRCGSSRGDARLLAELGLEELLTIAATSEEAA
jgi:hypothetical protein